MTVVQKLTIFEDLVRVTVFRKQIQGEPDMDYLRLLVIAVSKLPDKQFWNLSPAAQTWFNNAAATDNTLKQIPDCPGFKENQAIIKAQPVITVKKKHGGRRSSGVMEAIRQCVIIHPEWSARKTYLHLKENGWPAINLNTVTIDGGNVKRVIEMAREMGLWKEHADDKGNEKLTEGATIEGTTITPAGT